MDPNCREAACASKADMMKAMFSSQGGRSGKPASAGPSCESSTAPPMQCPPDRDELGRHSWTLLHTMAAYFPDKPDAAHREKAAAFVTALADLFPCSHCADDFKEALTENPPKVSSREELSVWVCEMHNHVNSKIGKPVFSCNLSELDRRWRFGGPECALDGDQDPATPPS